MGTVRFIFLVLATQSPILPFTFGAPATVIDTAIQSPRVKNEDKRDFLRGSRQRKILEEPLTNLNFEPIAFYQPRSKVTAHAAIDLDQKSMETQLALGTDVSFQYAKAIFEQGGHSKSFANLTLTDPLPFSIEKDTVLIGTSESFWGNGTNVSGIVSVHGKTFDDFPQGSSYIHLVYETTTNQATYVDCQVGALKLVGEANTHGCFASEGSLRMENSNVEEAGNGNDTTNAVTLLNYNYDIINDNLNGRTLSSFSTSAEELMYTHSQNCTGCPYEEYKKYYNYYGLFDYANEWVIAALEGRPTSFKQGNYDFSEQTFVGRGESAKKGSAYMSVYMAVLRELYLSYDICNPGCTGCNYESIHAWDRGVAYYAGSLEGADGTNQGVLLHELADKRSKDFRTGGPDGVDIVGTSKINYDLMTLFTEGQFELSTGNCNAANNLIPRVAAKMAVPLIQGTLRYAYKLEFDTSAGEKEKAEGATFAAAVLPRLHACSESAAKIVLDNMRQRSTKTKFSVVKEAFESQYPCLDITCRDVGGIWNSDTNSYFSGAAPCSDGSTKYANAQTSTGPNPIALGLGISSAVIAVLACGCIGFLIRREKSGNPVFLTSQHNREMS